MYSLSLSLSLSLLLSIDFKNSRPRFFFLTMENRQIASEPRVKGAGFDFCGFRFLLTPPSFERKREERDILVYFMNQINNDSFIKIPI